MLATPATIPQFYANRFSKLARWASPLLWWIGTAKAIRIPITTLRSLQQIASETHFQVALLYNEAQDQDDDAQTTDAEIASFDKAYKNYFGPTAKYRDAYLTYNGRPVIFIFPKGGHVDWNRVREHCSGWDNPPLLIYKDEPPAKYADDFAGSYAWVQPGPGGWAADGSNWGQAYLENFYKTMQQASRQDRRRRRLAWLR